MNDQAPVRFDFHGDSLELFVKDDRLSISVRRVCEALGLDNAAQQHKLHDKPWAVVGQFSMTGPDGKVYDTLCIDLESLPLWLATIDARRVKPTIRPKIITYQIECAKVLRDHFLIGPLRTQVHQLQAHKQQYLQLSAAYEELETDYKVQRQDRERDRQDQSREREDARVRTDHLRLQLVQQQTDYEDQLRDQREKLAESQQRYHRAQGYIRKLQQRLSDTEAAYYELEEELLQQDRQQQPAAAQQPQAAPVSAPASPRPPLTLVHSAPSKPAPAPALSPGGLGSRFLRRIVIKARGAVEAIKAEMEQARKEEAEKQKGPRR